MSFFFKHKKGKTDFRIRESQTLEIGMHGKMSTEVLNSGTVTQKTYSMIGIPFFRNTLNFVQQNPPLLVLTG